MAVGRILSLSALALAVHAAAWAAPSEPLEVRIGLADALTGPLANFGKDDENGARMAIDELNARGVSIGGRKARFVLLAEDDASEPRMATSVAQKFVDAKVNAVIGHETSGTSIPASKIYFDAGIPQITTSATSPQYTEQGFNTTFRTVSNDKQLGRALGRYAGKVLGLKRVALIDDHTAYGQGLASEFVKGFKESGGNIVAREATNDKAAEFGPILTRIRALRPEMIFFGGMTPVAAPMLRQMKALGMGQLRFMGGDGICTDQMLTLAQGAMAEGQVLCAGSGGVDEAHGAALARWRADYRKRFGIDSLIYSPYVYDSVMALAAAMEKAGSSTPAQYRPVLASNVHKGVTGPIAFDQRGDIRDGTLTLYTFRNGQRAMLGVIR
ncbi:branched-chain amino acid ABC transporter substrate-binding protein [Massilia terrae]|uniref:Branched-chain amino acid ABC transporter substrate-binding protein n=1 Tax=Massilia terrae TaxID=1811224 RepID=A0ABT2CUM8_9BURK|nr:branched-chain amino acid ABC transporter substrate-binding protein [Massilia terrae]MCS0657306.1 branched-chain amino acid ABC transporter substrate-binding protein [Massilia terrae]